MKRTALIGGLLVVLLAASPASAALTITKIYFNPAGADSGDPGHIRKEIVVVKNTGSHAVRLDGWRIHSGRGQDSATATTHGDAPTYYDFYWDLDNYVWNNDGDRATLRNFSKEVVGRCSYAASTGSPKMC